MRPPLDAPIVAVWDCGLTEQELEVALEMMRSAGIASPAALLHAALYHFACHLELDVPIETFDIGRPRPRKAIRAGQVGNSETVPVAPDSGARDERSKPLPSGRRARRRSA